MARFNQLQNMQVPLHMILTSRMIYKEYGGLKNDKYK